MRRTTTDRHARRAALTAMVLVSLWAARARAAPDRYAIIVGDNQGDRDEVELRYAEDDARRIGTVLREVGRFFPENVATLTAVTADDVRRALIALNARLRQAPSPSAGTLLMVFYSGHGDAESLHLRRTRLSVTELRDLVAGSSADARVLVVDSCRSGALTRVKGGRPGPSFDVRVDDAGAPKGLAILTSSAAGEDAQESDQLQSSVFTHHLVSALMGAGDRDGDGHVNVDEAFGYASDRTLASTIGTWPGPQHPTYRFELGGRDDLTLTWPISTADRGVLRFASAGVYLVQRDGPEGPIVAELSTDRPGGALAVQPGRYYVMERNREFLRQESFLVAPGSVTAVESARMRRVDYARVVRKGTVDRTRALSVVATGGVRGPLEGLGTAWGGGVGVRLDLPNASLELQLGFASSVRDNDWLRITSRETAASLAALHVFDLGGLSLGAGLGGGLAWFAQRFDSPGTAPRDGLAAFLGPLAQIEVPLARRWYARVDGAFLTYLMDVGESGDARTLSTCRAGAGLGAYF
ncbi:MAG: caspase family protein [Myxococcales bacterium]